MSNKPSQRKTTINGLQSMKSRGIPIAAIGVYESVTASIADQVGMPLFMTGPSGPMSLYGHDNPARISMEEQISLLRAVTRVTKYAMVAAHLPFLAFQTSRRDAVVNAGRLISEGGADVVKCDATIALSENIKAIIDAGIPVIAHIGVQALRRTEQSGYGLKGSTAATAQRLLEDTAKFEELGVFAIVAEHVCADVAAMLAERLTVPVISLGSGSRTDGACIVAGDLLNFSAFQRPAHATSYGDLRALVHDGLRRFLEQVRDFSYPDPKHSISMDTREYENFLELVTSSGGGSPKSSA
jgi:3-methyl-2-oxobutanoate hydroxymethyltransferase